MEQGGVSFTSCTTQTSVIITKPEGNANSTSQCQWHQLVAPLRAWKRPGLLHNQCPQQWDRATQNIQSLGKQRCLISCYCNLNRKLYVLKDPPSPTGVATKHLSLSLLNLEAFHWEVIQHEINLEHPLLGQLYSAFPIPAFTFFFKKKKFQKVTCKEEIVQLVCVLG